jgi:hypothetical protein
VNLTPYGLSLFVIDWNSSSQGCRVFANPPFSPASVLLSVLQHTEQASWGKLRALEILRIVPRCIEHSHRWLRGLAKISAADSGRMRKTSTNQEHSKLSFSAAYCRLNHILSKGVQGIACHNQI